MLTWNQATVMKMGVLEELLREAEELLKTGDTKRAMDVLLTAWAYREAGC